MVARQTGRLTVLAHAAPEQVADAFRETDLALGTAAYNGDEQVIDEQLPARQLVLPLLLNQVAYRIVEGRLQPYADTPADDMMIENETRRTHSTQGGSADDLAVIDLVGIRRLEGKSFEI